MVLVQNDVADGGSRTIRGEYDKALPKYLSHANWRGNTGYLVMIPPTKLPGGWKRQFGSTKKTDAELLAMAKEALALALAGKMPSASLPKHIYRRKTRRGNPALQVSVTIAGKNSYKCFSVGTPDEQLVLAKAWLHERTIPIASSE
jgi:hypothetical protein